MDVELSLLRQVGIFVVLKPQDLVGEIVCAVPCDEMQELAEKFGKGTWLRENDAGMGVILGGPLLGERKEIFSITRDDDALLARGKGQLFFVGMTEVPGCLSGQAIDAARCENVCQQRLDVFV